MHKNKDGIYIYNQDAYKGIKKSRNLPQNSRYDYQYVEPGVTTEELDKNATSLRCHIIQYRQTLGYEAIQNPVVFLFNHVVCHGILVKKDLKMVIS